MIEDDKGKPMSIMERISDEPCEPEAYIDYMIRDFQSRLAYWATLVENRDRGLAAFWMRSFVSDLEDLKRKMHRSTRAQFLKENGPSSPSGSPDGPA